MAWDPFADPSIESPGASSVPKPKVDRPEEPQQPPEDLDPFNFFNVSAEKNNGGTKAAEPAIQYEEPPALEATPKPQLRPAAKTSSSPVKPATAAQPAAAQPPSAAGYPQQVKPSADQEHAMKLQAHLRGLQQAKVRAVEEEDYETAASIKKQIAAVEKSLEAAGLTPSPAPKVVARKHPEDANQVDREARMRPDEKVFWQKAMSARKAGRVTDDVENGIPTWALEGSMREGPQAMRTERPKERDYQFEGKVAPEAWEKGADFQTIFIVRSNIQDVWKKVCGGQIARPEQSSVVDVRYGTQMVYLPSGLVILQELLKDTSIEGQRAEFRITVSRPAGSRTLESAKKVTAPEQVKAKPFYSFISAWALREQVDGQTEIKRIIHDFAQSEMHEFPALKSLARSVEVENERVRSAMVSAVSLKSKGAPAIEDGVLYSAVLEVEAPLDFTFEAVSSLDLLLEYFPFTADNSLLMLDSKRSIIRQRNGMAIFMETTADESAKTCIFRMTGAKVGNTLADSLKVTEEHQVVSKAMYHVTEYWSFTDSDSGKKTKIVRVVQEFEQVSSFEITDLEHRLAELTDGQNDSLRTALQRLAALEAGARFGDGHETGAAVSVRASNAMRSMPQLLEEAASGNVLAVREMLEVKGANPNYIHVRKDGWMISDVRMEFFEEVTPLIVAAEHGQTEVIKVLFNHPQIDVNLCCCAFTDMEIFRYYTALDMTVARKQPHAQALLKARGVLSADSEFIEKPDFDDDRGVPLRRGSLFVQEEVVDANAMPKFDDVDDPELFKALQMICNNLSRSRSQDMKTREGVFKTLITDWHPDRNRSKVELATKVFQWLQKARAWYMQEGSDVVSENAPIGDKIPAGAEMVIHPSGFVFSLE